jgi:class 3 adenylate cyclase
MTKFLHDLSQGADSATIGDWRRYIEFDQPGRAVKIQEMRDPLFASNRSFGHVIAVCGIDIVDASTAPNIVHFWHEGLNERRVRMNENREKVICCISFFMKLMSHLSVTPQYEDFFKLVDDKSVAQRLNSYYGEGALALAWYLRGNMYVVALHRKVVGAVKISSDEGHLGRAVSPHSVVDLLALHLDYYRYRSPMNLVAPTKFLSTYLQADPHWLNSLLVEPRYFAPWADPGSFNYLWPWQRCLTVKAGTASDLEHSSIATCSLVFDLRRSFLAMELLSQVDGASRYTTFIRSVLGVAKRQVKLWGGFFDKETGDGIVAHFSDPDHRGCSPSRPSPELRAFQAARGILGEVQVLCTQLQENLNLELDELGGAIGLHSGQATWIYDEDQISAVGDSVILAARLCSEAPPRSIYVSVPVHRSVIKSDVNLDGGVFERKKYQGKEYSDRSTLNGFLFELEC